MPYKLVYFYVRGRGMHIRYLCLDNGIELEEQMVAFDQWPTVKPTTDFGQLPVLYDGTFQVAQSNAILRFLARKKGLYGKNDQEATLIDMINDQQEDVRNAYLRMIYREYDTGKDAYIKTIPDNMVTFEKFLGKNNAGTGFLVGDQISFADYALFDLLDNHLILSPGCLDGFPLLKAFHGRIGAHEKIARYRQTDAFKKMPVNGNGKQ